MMQEPEIKRWTAKRKAELIKQIYRGQTTVPEAAREHDLTQAEIERSDTSSKFLFGSVRNSVSIL